MLAALRKRRANRVAAIEIAELERIAAIPFPTARVPLRLVESQKQRSYEEVAQKLDFVPAELTRAQLLEFFETEGIKLYDYGQVSAWLTEKKEQAKATHWCWRALRETDIITGYRWGYNREKGVWNDGFYSSGDDKKWQCRPYERLVPLHALEKVAKIEAKFGDRVKFLVSDYASPNADPFIMVRPAMCDSGTNAEYNLVFDVWDEPGFGV
ncbi:MAG: hypothetical protein AAB518_02820 [Patescibacteria group bacterium]